MISDAEASQRGYKIRAGLNALSQPHEQVYFGIALATILAMYIKDENDLDEAIEKAQNVSILTNMGYKYDDKAA